jgi:glycosyltransferase involved in cell wall biosynthesis
MIAKHYARQAMSRITADHDLVFGVGTLPISYLECRQPIVVWTDATFASLVDFYPIYTNISSESVRHGNALEKAALERCRLIVYSSDWAAQSAIDDYGIDPVRVVVVPFGANMDTDLSEEEAESAVAGRPDEVCRLLFMGVEWERKGGPLAIEIAAELNAAGLPTQLDVVGPWPRGTERPAFVNPLGFLDKSSPAGRQKLRHLLLGSHFMVLPARADCTPVVLNEAAAHALPALATSVGGIPTIIRNGANGRLFSADADAAEYAAYVIDTLSSQDGYRQLAQASFEEYRLRLNWEVAGKAVRRLVDDALQSA